jgi:hypothetical protein
MGSKTFAVKQSAGVLRPGGLLDKYFYFAMSLLVASVVVYGFSQTIDHNLIHAEPRRPWLLWVHGALFSSWLAFFILQSALVRTHNVKLHRTLGWFGAGVGTLITIVGTSTAIVMDRFYFLRAHHPGPKLFFAIQLLDMLSFTSMFWLAVYWRKKPEFHRRLILIAICVLTSEALMRFPHSGPDWAYCGVDGLILLGVIRDLVVHRKVHVVYRYAVPALIVLQILMFQIWRQQPQWWVKATNAIMG